jgi:hypothetical protein
MVGRIQLQSLAAFVETYSSKLCSATWNMCASINFYLMICNSLLVTIRRSTRTTFKMYHFGDACCRMYQELHYMKTICTDIYPWTSNLWSICNIRCMKSWTILSKRFRCPKNKYFQILLYFSTKCQTCSQNCLSTSSLKFFHSYLRCHVKVAKHTKLKHTMANS